MSKVFNKIQEKKKKMPQKGVVVSDVMDKTVVVEVTDLKTHPKYKKKIRFTKKYHVHDENNSHKIGETVLFEECRPISKTKKRRIVEKESKKE